MFSPPFSGERPWMPPMILAGTGRLFQNSAWLPGSCGATLGESLGSRTPKLYLIGRFIGVFFQHQ